MDKYIGFDIDDKKTVACVVQDGQEDHFQTLCTDLQQMRRFLAEQGKGGHRVHLTFEISGRAGFWYDALGDVVEDITVSNPHQLTWIYRTSKKNDRIDARKQAVLLRLGELPAVYMPSKEVRHWRGLIQHRRNIVATTTRTKNRIKALLKGQGFSKAAERGSWWKKANRRWMRGIVARVGATGEAFWCLRLENLLDQLALQERQRRDATAYLDGYLERQASAEVLLSIPGVGPRTAEAILAYTADVSRFRSGKAYGAYFGLTPKLAESGSVRRLGHISKQGPSVVRWLIVESAWRALGRSPALRAFWARVMSGQTGRKKIATVAVARKLLCIVRAMLIRGERFNESLVCRECGGSGMDKNEKAA
jgi:transposase